jgi:hypothetical protein
MNYDTSLYVTFRVQSSRTLRQKDRYQLFSHVPPSDSALNTGEPSTTGLPYKEELTSKLPAVLALASLSPIYNYEMQICGSGTNKRTSSLNQCGVTIMQSESRRLALFLSK